MGYSIESHSYVFGEETKQISCWWLYYVDLRERKKVVNSSTTLHTRRLEDKWSVTAHLFNLKRCYLKGKRKMDEKKREKKQPEFINQWHALLTHSLQESPNTCFSGSCSSQLKSLTFMLFTKFRRFFSARFLLHSGACLKSKLKIAKFVWLRHHQLNFFMVDLWFLAVTTTMPSSSSVIITVHDEYLYFGSK